MISFFAAFLGWLPSPLFEIAVGVVAIFVIVAILRLISFILDLIPFL